MYRAARDRGGLPGWPRLPGSARDLRGTKVGTVKCARLLADGAGAGGECSTYANAPRGDRCIKVVRK